MDIEYQIRQRAFRIWVAEGQPCGKEREHWERAKAELIAEQPRFAESSGWDRAAAPPRQFPVSPER